MSFIKHNNYEPVAKNWENNPIKLETDSYLNNVDR